MRLTEILLLLLAGWTAVGAVGVTVSFMRQQRQKAWKDFSWIAGIWVIYLAILLGTSLLQPQRIVPPATPQCFGEMCFSVIGADEIPGYLMRDGRLVRVKVSIANRGHKPESEPLLRSYLLDQQGRRWTEVPGLSGVSLKTRVPAGATVISEPVFKLPTGASPRGLVFTHGPLQPGVLVLGDSDSLLHRQTIAMLAK